MKLVVGGVYEVFRFESTGKGYSPLVQQTGYSGLVEVISESNYAYVCRKLTGEVNSGNVITIEKKDFEYGWCRAYELSVNNIEDFLPRVAVGL